MPEGCNCANMRRAEGASNKGVLEMCDFSLQSVRSRPAQVGDKLLTRNFGTGTRGFATADDLGLAASTACTTSDRGRGGCPKARHLRGLTVEPQTKRGRATFGRPFFVSAQRPPRAGPAAMLAPRYLFQRRNVEITTILGGNVGGPSDRASTDDPTKPASNCFDGP
jgi:hypothetical protein